MLLDVPLHNGPKDAAVVVMVGAAATVAWLFGLLVPAAVW